MTYVIIDIDGVLNPFGARNNAQLNFTWHGDDKEGWFLKPELHVPWITKIREHSDFIWGSAWAAQSNLLLELLGLDETWKWIPLQTEDVGMGTWKIKSIKQWVETLPQDEKIVWLDDELEEDAFQWAKERGNMLAICPDRWEGLTEEDFRNIHEFVSS